MVCFLSLPLHMRLDPTIIKLSAQIISPSTLPSPHARSPPRSGPLQLYFPRENGRSISVDTVIANGTIVTSESTLDGAIAIEDGTIVGIGREEPLPTADREIDASGLCVMPGVVDPHVHINDHVSLDSYESATSAAALGGATSLIDFAWQAYVGDESHWEAEGTLTEGVERKR